MAQGESTTHDAQSRAIAMLSELPADTAPVQFWTDLVTALDVIRGTSGNFQGCLIRYDGTTLLVSDQIKNVSNVGAGGSRQNYP